LLAYIYNPSTDQEYQISSPVEAKSYQEPILTNKLDMVSVIPAMQKIEVAEAWSETSPRKNSKSCLKNS
jgi:hypothetical protein